MHDREDKDFETVVKRAFTRLTRQDLPRAAESRGWPIRTPAEFERLLLAHLGNSSGEARPCMVDMVLAVELGEGLLSGELCCHTMNRRVRCEVAKGDPRRAEALKALLEVLAGRG
jgi:hypothetical protein